MASYNLNLIPGDAPVVVHVNQYDRGYTIDFTVYDGDTVFSLAGYTAVINIGKPDKNVYAGGTVVLRGNVATITLEEQMTAMWGPCIAELVFTNSNGRRATANFILDVEKSPLEDGAQSESVINYIESSLEAAEGATEAAESATTAATAAAVAARDAARSAANVAANIANMPEVLRQLSVTLADTTGDNKIICLDHNGNVSALSAGYVTPLMYGAKGDGTTDDTAAFEAALASGERVVVPMATYKLTQVLWTDDSVVVNDSGTYNTKPLIVSKDVRDSAPVEHVVKQFNASTANVRDYSLRGACYDSANDRIVVAYGTSYTDINGQGAGICYNPNTHKIYAACGNGTNGRKIAVIDPDTLALESWQPAPVSYRVWGIAYDPDNDMYYCTYEVDGEFVNGAVSSSFGLIDKAFPVLTDTVKEAAGLSASDVLVAEQAVVYGQQILQLFSGPGAAYIAQHNYADNSLKKAYRIASDYLTGDDPKALVNVSGKIYMLTDIAGTDGQRCVSVSQLVMDERVDGNQGSYDDAKILVADVCRDEESFDSEGFVKRVNRLSASTGHRKVDARLFTLKDI